MKKSVLLTSAFMLAASFANAQSVDKANAPVMLKNFAAMKNAVAVEGKAPMKSYDNGVYYSRPVGTVFNGITSEFRAYNQSLLVVPPFTELVFKNQTLDPSKTVWSYNGKELTADENGDLNFGTLGAYDSEKAGAYYYYPKLSTTDGKSSFTLGEWNENGGGIMVDSISDLCFVDKGAGYYAFSSNTFPSSFLYANEKVGDTGFTANSFLTYYEKPISPLYIEYVNLPYMWYSENPLPANTPITMTFVETTTSEDGTPQLTNNVIGTMTGTAENLSLIDAAQTAYTPSGMLYVYMLQLANRATDDIGIPTVEPIVINKPFAVLVSGFDAEGVHAGLYGCEIKDEDAVAAPYPTYMISTKEGEDDRWYRYNQTQLFYSFHGGFDYVNPMENGQYSDGTKVSDLNQLKVSADGSTVENVGGGADMNYAVMYCAFNWIDSESESENYTTELPEWIKEIQYNQASAGTTYISVACDALPAGVKGRGAKLYFTGHGFTSDVPLYVLQGDYTKAEADATGISIVSADKNKNNNNRVYNLAGQQVSKDYKGLVIKNGAKVLVK